MNGNIVAAYQTPHGVCYISDAAYTGKSPAELQQVRKEISATVQSILERVVRDGGADYEALTDRIERRRRGEIPLSAVPIPLPEATP